MPLKPTQQQRRYRTPGGGLVTWRWWPEKNEADDVREWGKMDCTGCRGDFPMGLTPVHANDHARRCCQIPE